jgi:hypothetical protein
MSVICRWGLQAILPDDYTKDQVIGNLRMLVRLGFSERIVEVINGKPLEFTLENNLVAIDEMEDESNLLKNADIVTSIWEHDEGIIDDQYWKEISPDGAILFLPSDNDFYEQIDNIPGAPVYTESIGNVIRRIDLILLETPPGLNDVYRNAISEIRKTFYTALKFNFVVTVHKRKR